MLTRTLPVYLQDASHPQAQVCAACEVRRNALFGALDDASLARIHEHIAAPEYEADTRIYSRDEPGHAVWTIRAGVVRFERTTDRGDRRIVRLAGRGDLIGQEALLRWTYADDAIACTPVQLCRIPPALVEDLSESRARLLRELMARWQDALDQAQGWVADLTTGPARRRVLRLLDALGRYPDAQGRIWLPRREDIGAMLDMTIETASRHLSRLRREAVIELLPPRHARLSAPALEQALRAADAD